MKPENSRLTAFIQISLVAFAVMALVYLLSDSGGTLTEASSLAIPAVRLEQVGGGELDLASLSGEPFLLEIWSYNCGHCRNEIPGLGRLHASGELRMVSLIYDPESAESAGRLERLGVEYPVYRAGDALLNKLEVAAFPTAYLVGPDGTAVERITGFKDEETLRRLAQRAKEFPRSAE